MKYYLDTVRKKEYASGYSERIIATIIMAC